MTTTGKLAMAVLIGGLGAGLGGAVGCGGVSGSDVASARTQATTASCNYFMMCNKIGPGMSANGGYDTYQDCMTTVGGQWTSGWSTTQCQGHIDQQALTVCIDAINSTTDCNAVAELITLSKCSAATVCSANVTDGGAGN
jgi:hypothetical protein